MDEHQLTSPEEIQWYERQKRLSQYLDSLEACCREAPCTPSPTLQVALRERFDLQVSVSQINRVRAALGVSNRSRTSRQEKNGRIERPL